MGVISFHTSPQALKTTRSSGGVKIHLCTSLNLYYSLRFSAYGLRYPFNRKSVTNGMGMLNFLCRDGLNAHTHVVNGAERCQGWWEPPLHLELQFLISNAHQTFPLSNPCTKRQVHVRPPMLATLLPFYWIPYPKRIMPWGLCATKPSNAQFLLSASALI